MYVQICTFSKIYIEHLKISSNLYIFCKAVALYKWICPHLILEHPQVSECTNFYTLPLSLECIQICVHFPNNPECTNMYPLKQDPECAGEGRWRMWGMWGAVEEVQSVLGKVGGGCGGGAE